MGSGRGKQRRAQAARAGEDKSFRRESENSLVRVESEEDVLGDRAIQSRSAPDDLALCHVISTVIEDDAPGLCRGPLKLETQAESAGEGLVDNGVAFRAFGVEFQFTSRREFHASLLNATRREPSHIFEDEHGKKYAFVPAVANRGSKPGAREVLLVNNPGAADRIRNATPNNSEHLPGIDEYEKECKIFLSLTSDEAACVDSAFDQELSNEDAYLAFLKDRKERELRGDSPRIPDLDRVSF